MLTQLKSAIETEVSLQDDDKRKALEQLKTIADAAKDPDDTIMKKWLKEQKVL